MRNEIKKEKPPSNKEARSYIIGKFFKSYFKKFMYNISIGGMPLVQFCVRLHMGGENNNRYCTLPWQSPPILRGGNFVITSQDSFYYSSYPNSCFIY